jgi:hypothetical protein
MKKLKLILFWLITGFLCFELVYGALWDLNVLNKNYVSGILRHLGYPMYLGTILGAAKLIAAAILLPNGLKLAKEWAYTGTFVLFFCGFVSHLFSGDSFAQFVFALIFAIMTILSYLLRPQNRKIVLI